MLVAEMGRRNPAPVQSDDGGTAARPVGRAEQAPLLQGTRSRRRDDQYDMAKLTNVRRATPVGPLANQGLASSFQAVPAMSRWIQGVSPANSRIHQGQLRRHSKHRQRQGRRFHHRRLVHPRICRRHALDPPGHRRHRLERRSQALASQGPNRRRRPHPRQPRYVVLTALRNSILTSFRGLRCRGDLAPAPIGPPPVPSTPTRTRASARRLPTECGACDRNC